MNQEFKFKIWVEMAKEFASQEEIKAVIRDLAKS